MRISVVSYLNSLPFIAALERLSEKKAIQLFRDVPSACAEKLLTGKADIGLIPVAVIPELKTHFIVSDFCIGAYKEVKSVMLYSMVPLSGIKTISLDPHSRTSARLVQLLAKHHWKISPLFIADERGEHPVSDSTAALVIGNRALMLQGKFPYQYDLAEAWFQMTGLPFVFACWVSTRQPEREFLRNFNAELKLGVENRAMLDLSKHYPEIPVDLKFDYINKIICYELNSEFEKGLKLFLDMI